MLQVLRRDGLVFEVSSGIVNAGLRSVMDINLLSEAFDVILSLGIIRMDAALSIPMQKELRFCRFP